MKVKNIYIPVMERLKNSKCTEEDLKRLYPYLFNEDTSTIVSISRALAKLDLDAYVRSIIDEL